jgi:hypothetical protein
MWVPNFVSLHFQQSVDHETKDTNVGALYFIWIFGDEVCVTLFEI